ncbi:MAG: 6-phosphofructokinase [TACK group archaeon]|nr:6-phosphofructokinase [TACK group archaeon]
MKILAVQSGGPSPGSNPALAGAISACHDGCELLGAVGGWIGLAKGNVISLNGIKPERIASSPSPYLVTFRDRTSEDAIMASIRRLDVDAMLIIGGEGSTAFVKRLRSRADIGALVVAKTIDNDLGPFHHDLGYPSSAERVADFAVRMRYDASSYIGYVEVDLMQVMGRDAGWLTLASALAGKHAPDLFLLPETTYDVEELLAEVKRIIGRVGKALVAISEGVTVEDGKLVRATDYQRAGAAPALRDLLQAQGIRTRYEWPGILYRCVEPNERDKKEGMDLGRLAIEKLLKGQEGVLGPDERGKPELVTLDEASKRYVPSSFLNGFLPSAEALHYLRQVCAFHESSWAEPLSLA